VSTALVLEKRAMDMPLVLDGIRQVVEDLVKAIGIPCEIVLHDLRDPSRSIAAIAGGITGRSIGGPTTDLVLRLLRSEQVSKNLIGYASTSPQGIPLRSSTIFVRDEAGEVVGCLCINIDLTYWNIIHNIVSNLCETSAATEPADTVTESFETGVTDMLRLAVEEALRSIGQPVSRMQKQEKLEVVRSLDEGGAFLIRGAVDYIADALNVSRPTIYNYLAELRSSERFMRVS
jgi:predicted transcriptional regulator YheO